MFGSLSIDVVRQCVDACRFRAFFGTYRVPPATQELVSADGALHNRTLILESVFEGVDHVLVAARFAIEWETGGG